MSSVYDKAAQSDAQPSNALQMLRYVDPALVYWRLTVKIIQRFRRTSSVFVSLSQ